MVEAWGVWILTDVQAWVQGRNHRGEKGGDRWGPQANLSASVVRESGCGHFRLPSLWLMGFWVAKLCVQEREREERPRGLALLGRNRACVEENG